MAKSPLAKPSETEPPAANESSSIADFGDLPGKAPERLLIIRLSSFGDIVQAMGVPAAFKKRYPGAQVDWLVREDFSNLITGHPEITDTIAFQRNSGLKGLISLSWQLANRGYSHVYDAHNNVRSRVIGAVFFLRRLMGTPAPKFARRPKDRLRRWLMFQFRFSTLPRPFRGADSFHRPLQPWGIPLQVPRGRQFFPAAQLTEILASELARLPRPLIALAPSAAWQMKRWPLEHWRTLIKDLCVDHSIVFLGGPSDTFIEDLNKVAPQKCLNLAGRLSLIESCATLCHVDLLIANDTGLLHVADQMERPAIALIGPTAFGYPSHDTSTVLEIDLPCKPCTKDGRGRCSNSVYQRCLVELQPERVALEARRRTQREKA